MAKYGIDVCEYQGAIDWSQVKKAGCKFAVLKCIKKRLDLDSKFVANVKGCRENGIPISVYTYVYENTVEGAEKRAKAAVAACKEQGVKSCIIWWDVEDPAIRKTGVDNRAKLTKSIKAARAIITAAGFGFGVYCDSDFYTSCINANELGGRYWIAAYHGNPVTTLGQSPKYKKPTIANELCGWQFCSRGRVPGISGSVDLNVAYDDDYTTAVKDSKPTTAPKKSATGNPFKAPDLTVTSDIQASKKHITFYASKGEGVRYVQWELHRLGYDVGAIDGICGTQTVKAIMAFQKDAGLTVDGLAGKNTVAALETAKEKPKPATPVNYMEKVAKAAKAIYPLCVGRKHGKGVQKKVTSLEQFKRQKELNCHLMVSLVLQEAGLLPKGAVITHTPKSNGKTFIEDAVKGIDKLKNCEVHWVNKSYKDLPEKWKKAGCIYIQNSNACISAGNGKIWSCNKSVGHKYQKGEYLRTSGYPFDSKILVVIVPKAC